MGRVVQEARILTPQKQRVATPFRSNGLAGIEIVLDLSWGNPGLRLSRRHKS